MNMEQSHGILGEDLYNLQMEIKQVQYAQSNHADRISRLEKRQTDDSAIKSAWNSPFPGVLSSTPQHGPVQIPHNDVFDDLDEQGEELLGSLHLGPAEEEPVRRGAASRANSVRFDESALHGSSWSNAANQSNRHSGDFGSMRPPSGLLMERTLSHKSDGRHSSAGHSVHSHHSVASGRASSVGLDAEDDDSSSFEVPEPPVSLYVLGSVPSLIRCWLTMNFAHSTLLYADVCSGAQTSTISQSLLDDLELNDDVRRDGDGVYRIRLNVYFAEAVVTRRNRPSDTPGGLVPSITVVFEVIATTTTQNAPNGNNKNAIGIFIGSDALRAHSADILFSQNMMVLYGNDRDRLRVPFVRPEDDGIFRNLCTSNMPRERQKLNANAAPFVFSDAVQISDNEAQVTSGDESLDDQQSQNAMSPTAVPSEVAKPTEIETKQDAIESNTKPTDNMTESNRKHFAESGKRDTSSGIWGPWRNNGTNGTGREGGSISGYQPPPRSGRGMKILKSGKSSSSTRASTAQESVPTRSSEGRRKSQVSIASDGGNPPPGRSDLRRSNSRRKESKPRSQSRESRTNETLPRSSNPIGGASAFSWMTPGSLKPSKISSSATE